MSCLSERIGNETGDNCSVLDDTVILALIDEEEPNGALGWTCWSGSFATASMSFSANADARKL